MTHYTDISYEVNGAIARITIDRPGKLNSMRVETYEQIQAAFEQADADSEVRVIVLTGRGDRAFSAGGDLEMATTLLKDPGAPRRLFLGKMMRLSTTMLHVDKPIICAVNGLCVGGGAELMLFADLVIASDRAYFKFNGTEIGGCSWWGAPQLLPGFVGGRRAEYLLYLSQRVSAHEAERMGLVNKTVDHQDFTREVSALCESLLALSPEGIRLTKRAIRTSKSALLAEMATHAEINAAVVGAPEMQRAFSSVLSK